jgi:hypothetical protein
MLFARAQVNPLHKNKRERVEAGQEPEYLMPLKTERVSEIGSDSLQDRLLVLLRHRISAFLSHENPLVTIGIAPYSRTSEWRELRQNTRYCDCSQVMLHASVRNVAETGTSSS